MDDLECARNFVSLSRSCVSSEVERVVGSYPVSLRGYCWCISGLHPMKNEVLVRVSIGFGCTFFSDLFRTSSLLRNGYDSGLGGTFWLRTTRVKHLERFITRFGDLPTRSRWLLRRAAQWGCVVGFVLSRFC